MTPTALPTFNVSVKWAAGADNDGWAIGSSALPVQLGEPDDGSQYEDVNSDVRSITVRRGRSRELELYQAGSASIVLDNLSRAYDPLNLDGPHVDGGGTQVKPGRRIRVSATHPDTLIEYQLFAGVVRDWVSGYVHGFDATTTAQASDALTDLNGIIISIDTSAGASGVAAAEVLGAAGISRIDVDAGVASLQATSFTSASALAVMQSVTLSEQGALYANKSGVVQFDDRHAILKEARSNTSQFSFGTGNLPVLSISLDYSSDLIKNAVTVARTGGSPQTTIDSASIMEYGTRSLNLSGMMLSTDAQALETAAFVVNAYSEPAVRVRQITVAPQTHADLLTAVLSLELRDRVTVTFQPPGGGGVISQEVFVEGVQHNVTPHDQMKTTLTFSSTATSFGWSLGTSALGTSSVLSF